ncbi:MULTISPECIES: hypothetical protein [Vibrio]|uniref:hypothetical protein n=1 Tax=Vibrio TaxID=662 RepID=UPI00057208A2|nr:hypothetical protein [Vibrio pacinii]
MCHGPSLESAIQKSEEAKKAVNEAVAKAQAALKNTEETAKEYIQSHTKGILEVESVNNQSYSKFSDEFNLDALDDVVDGIVKVAQDYLTSDEDPTKAAGMAADIGSVIKSTLALAATSSSTTEKLQVVFNHIVTDDKNYAVYYACNSMTVNAENAWGNKEITVVSNMYMFAEVEPNPEVTYAKILQEDLDALDKVNKQYDDAIVSANCEAELDALTFRQNKISILKEKIEKDLHDLGTPA